MRIEALERALLARRQQTRVAGHIDGEDRGETAGGSPSGHGSGAANSDCRV
jgi:hypothetical protein